MSHGPRFAQDSGVIAAPEIVEWQVKKPSDAYVLVCSDGTLDAAKSRAVKGGLLSKASNRRCQYACQAGEEQCNQAKLACRFSKMTGREHRRVQQCESRHRRIISAGTDRAKSALGVLNLQARQLHRRQPFHCVSVQEPEAINASKALQARIKVKPCKPKVSGSS